MGPGTKVKHTPHDREVVGLTGFFSLLFIWCLSQIPQIKLYYPSWAIIRHNIFSVSNQEQELKEDRRTYVVMTLRNCVGKNSYKYLRR